MKHTPGPWQQHDKEYCPFEIWGNLEGPMEDNQIHGTQICHVLDDNDQAQANAQLIAAAPELLEACKTAKEHCEELLRLWTLQLPKETIAILNSAISKAEDQSNA